MARMVCWPIKKALYGPASSGPAHASNNQTLAFSDSDADFSRLLHRQSASRLEAKPYSSQVPNPCRLAKPPALMSSFPPPPPPASANPSPAPPPPPLQQQPGSAPAAATLLVRHLPEAIPQEMLSRLFSHYGATSVRPCAGGKYSPPHLPTCAFSGVSRVKLFFGSS